MSAKLGLHRATVSKYVRQGEIKDISKAVGTSLDNSDELSALGIIENKYPDRASALIERAAHGEKVSAIAELRVTRGIETAQGIGRSGVMKSERGELTAIEEDTVMGYKRSERGEVTAIKKSLRMLHDIIDTRLSEWIIEYFPRSELPKVADLITNCCARDTAHLIRAEVKRHKLFRESEDELADDEEDHRRSEGLIRAHAKNTRKGRAARTPEERSESARKSAATRAARKALKEAAP